MLPDGGRKTGRRRTKADGIEPRRQDKRCPLQTPRHDSPASSFTVQRDNGGPPLLAQGMAEDHALLLLFPLPFIVRTGIRCLRRGAKRLSDLLLFLSLVYSIEKNEPFYTEKKLRTQESPQFFCFCSRSFINFTNPSGATACMQGPKDSTRMTSSVSSLS